MWTLTASSTTCRGDATIKIAGTVSLLSIRTGVSVEERGPGLGRRSEARDDFPTEPSTQIGRTSARAGLRPGLVEPDAPVNLWEPADGPDGRDFGARGVFDANAHTRDPQLWASQHHGLLGAAAAGISATVAAALLWARRR